MENNKPTISYERESRVEIGSVTVRSNPLYDMVNGLVNISNNNKMDAEKVINFFVNGEDFAVTATDRIVNAVIKGNCSSSSTISFAVKAQALADLLHEGVPTKFTLYKERVVVSRGDSRFDLKLYEVTTKPFTFGQEQFEIIPASKFISAITAMSKFISTNMDEFNAVVFNKGFVYVRDKLVYCISEFPIVNTYIFSKTICKQLTTLLGRKYNNSMKDQFGIRYNPTTSAVEIYSDNVRVKLASFNYSPVDLTPFIKVMNVIGNSMNKEEFKSSLKDIKASDDPSDLYITLEQDSVRIQPVSDKSLTNIKLRAKSNSETVSFSRGDSFKVKVSYLEKIINNINSPSIAIAKQQNMCVLVGVERELLIRYFISVM